MEQFRYNCPRCHFKTNDRTDYTRHINRMKPCPSLYGNQTVADILSAIEKPHKCPHCNKRFSHLSSYYRHKKTHTATHTADEVSTSIAEPEPETEPEFEPVCISTTSVAPPKIRQGHVYIVTSTILNGFKIGFSRSRITSLFNRYHTCYGKDVEFYLFPCQDCRLLEDISKILFRPHNLSCELYDRKLLEHYKTVLSNLCVLPDTELKTAFDSCIRDPSSFLRGLPQSSAPVFTHIFPFANT